MSHCFASTATYIYRRCALRAALEREIHAENIAEECYDEDVA
jgi:hypothetical protein